MTDMDEENVMAKVAVALDTWREFLHDQHLHVHSQFHWKESGDLEHMETATCSIKANSLSPIRLLVCYAS